MDVCPERTTVATNSHCRPAGISADAVSSSERTSTPSEAGFFHAEETGVISTSKNLLRIRTVAAAPTPEMSAPAASLNSASTDQSDPRGILKFAATSGSLDRADCQEGIAGGVGQRDATVRIDVGANFVRLEDECP